MSFLYIFLALLGLGLLVFIHELGHYFVARREGMKVEVFSIGLGRPLFSWMHRGVKWQVCLLLFGGYVRIAGMEKEGDKEPNEIPNGFYAKKPWARIKVALAGPVVNLAFALILFTVIWLAGGREKSFSEFTRLIGFVEPTSELYHHGVRPGDELAEYNSASFEGEKDLIYAAIFNGHDANIRGNKINYFSDQKTPYDYTLTPYASPYLRKGMMSIGILSLAHYLIYQANTPLLPDHPMAKSGIQIGDRIVWVNGQLIFSSEQLSELINDNRVLITFEREGKSMMAQVPRLSLQDLKLNAKDRLELSDWTYAANLNPKESPLFFIPYALTFNLTVERPLSFIDQSSSLNQLKGSEATLQVGDRLIAIDGKPVDNGPTFLTNIQNHFVQLIVERGGDHKPLLWKNEDSAFENETPWDDLLPLINSIGTSRALKQNGPFHLLNPITPVKRKDLPWRPKEKEELTKALEKQRQRIESIGDSGTREKALEELNKSQEQLFLGIALADRAVIYNPNPIALFGGVFREISYTLAALFGGHISPKFLVGPVGIVSVMQKSWGSGIKEALFWLGMISLNLGVFNLLPIPVLDGGHLLFSVLEAIRKKPFKAKTMRRAMLPFIALLIFFFFYVTYHDLMRLFGRFF